MTVSPMATVTGCELELRLHQIHTSDLLGDGVLDLHARAAESERGTKEMASPV